MLSKFPALTSSPWKLSNILCCIDVVVTWQRRPQAITWKNVTGCTLSCQCSFVVRCCMHIWELLSIRFKRSLKIGHSGCRDRAVLANHANPLSALAQVLTCLRGKEEAPKQSQRRSSSCSMFRTLHRPRAAQVWRPHAGLSHGSQHTQLTKQTPKCGKGYHSAEACDIARGDSRHMPGFTHAQLLVTD